MMRKFRFLLSVQIITLAFAMVLSTPTALAGSDELAAVLAAQPETIQARYKWRHPQETLEFFGVEPGMTVLEALPGGGWYTKILLPYLGTDGALIGADYALEMFPLFGFFSDEMLEGKKTWVETWTADAEGWRGENSASVSAFVLGSMPDELKGTVDVAIFIRALHNLNRFEPDGGYLTSALKDAFDALKSGGILGVVQHQAPEDKSDEWANGSRGYLKKSHVIAVIEKAGFELVGESAVNENPKDQPGDDDVVWRLPPTLSIGDAGDEVAAEMRAIGESNRMTLKFRKP